MYSYRNRTAETFINATFILLQVKTSGTMFTVTQCRDTIMYEHDLDY